MDIKQEVKKNIDELQVELSRLATAVSHIEAAKKMVEIVYEEGKILQTSYDNHMKEVQAFIKQQEAFCAQVERLGKVIDNVNSSMVGVNQSVQNIVLRIENTEKSLKSMIENEAGRVQTGQKEVKMLLVRVLIVLSGISFSILFMVFILWQKGFFRPGG